MQVTAEQTDPCTLVLDIAVDEQQVSRAFDATYREFGRYARVPGFRPGKAPRAVVERYVDTGRVRERALEKILSESFQKAIKEQGVTPFRSPQIDPPDLEDKKPYSYKATVPLDPCVKLGQYTGLTVQKPLFEVTDAMVEERINRLREDRARLERVADRGVEIGDVLIAENQVAIEGMEAPPPARRQIIQTGNNIPGFDEAILGMMPGDERSFELTYPEDYDEEEKRGKKATFTVKLSSISARIVPELDDKFASEVAGTETVDALRAAVRERVVAESARLSDQVAEQRLLEVILGNSEINFPEVLVREEVQDKLRTLEGQLKENNMPYTQYLERIGRSQEEHLGQLAAQSAAQVRTILVLREITLKEELQVDDAAVEAEFDRLLTGGSITEEQFEEYRADGQRRNQIANALIQQKLHDFLFANNTLEEVVETTQPSSEELAEAGEE